MEIKDYLLSATEYFQESNKKTNLVLHHTASGPIAENVAAWWNQDKTQIVATNFVMGRDGKIIRTVPEEYWAWNLGIGNGYIERKTLSIELCAWGNLNYQNGSFTNYVGLS